MEEIYKQIDERKAYVKKRGEAAVARINVAIKPYERGFDQRIAQIMDGTGSRRGKMMAMQEVMSDVRKFSANEVACKKGCSACCYQLVTLSQTEADAIGHKIGKKAVQLRPDYKAPERDSFGQHTPCTFLSDGTCSIYEHRPFMCRYQVNTDVDALLCGFENWDLQKLKDPRFTALPLLGTGPVMQAFTYLVGQDKLGDIRDFFPSQP